MCPCFSILYFEITLKPPFCIKCCKLETSEMKAAGISLPSPSASRLNLVIIQHKWQKNPNSKPTLKKHFPPPQELSVTFKAGNISNMHKHNTNFKPGASLASNYEI